MTNFKTFLRIVQKNIWVIIMYTMILVVVRSANSLSGAGQTSFVASKPNTVVYDHDGSEISKSLKKYFEEKTDVVEISEEGDNLSDALYFNQINYVIYLEKGFGEKIKNGEDFELNVKSEGDYGAYLSETILSRYVKVAKSFAGLSEKEIVRKTEDVLKNETAVELNSTLDVSGLTNATTYYNFLNYSILAGLVFSISYATIGFRRTMVRKRINASATSYKKINRDILLCSFALSLVLWVIYNILGVLVVGSDVVFTANGALMVANSFVLTIFAVVFALFLTNLVEKTDALNAVINIVSIGSSFLCGVFLPAKWMPEFVVNLARIFPSYYYVDSNNIIATLDKFDGEHLQPIVVNTLVLIGSTVVLIVLTNIISRKKRRNN